MKNVLFILLTLLLALSCINRDGPINPRNNEYDSGGMNYDRFSYNGAPSISGEVDTQWYDFDFNDNTGTLMLWYRADDPNTSTDTLLETTIQYGLEISSLETAIPVNDSQCLFDNLTPGVLYRCKLSVSDGIDTTDTVINFTAPGGLPPQPPEPTLTVGEESVTISWNRINEAMGYNIYSSESTAEPFLHDTFIIQALDLEDAVMSITLPLDDSSVRYYLVTSQNEAGESWARDTLMARIVSDDVAVPKIDSVSKGTYENGIEVIWETNDAAIASYELYRSTNDTLNFTLIHSEKATEDINSYFDSIVLKNPNNYYWYKLAAVDTKGRASHFSEIEFGHIKRPMETILLNIESEASTIHLFWDPNPDAAAYDVYRSSESCSDEMTKINTVTKPSYDDSPTTSQQYYYKVVPVNETGSKVGSQSTCVSGSIGKLPPPTNIHYSNCDFPNTISIYWDPLKRAESYIIFRSTSGCPDEDDVYAVTKKTEYHDTGITEGKFNYRIAGVDDAKRTGLLSVCHREDPTRITAPEFTSVSYLTYTDVIKLAWTKVEGAVSYNLYRSSTSCEIGMTKIKSITSTTYTDYVPSTSLYYYMVAGVDKNEQEGSRSSCQTGRLKPLSKPTASATKGVYADTIKITWNPITGASSYTIYHNTVNSFSSASKLVTVTGTAYYHSVTTDRTHYYWVAANNDKGEGLHSEYTYGWIIHAPILSVALSKASVALSWNADDTYSKFLIYRATDSSALKIYDSTTSTRRIDYNATYKGFYYQVKGRTSQNALIPSNIVLGYKLLPPPDGLQARESSDGVRLTWTALSEDVNYIIYRSRTSATTSSSDSIGIVSDTEYYDKTPTSTRYYYRIAADNGRQRSSISDFVFAGELQTPMTPTSVSATGYESYISIRWYVSSSSSTPTGFYIYRSGSDGVYSLIDTTEELFYRDTVQGSGVYYYRIAAFNIAGTSKFSESVEAQLAAPESPSGVDASYGTRCADIVITWNSTPFEDDSFAVYRGTSSWGDFNKIGVSADTVYQDTNVVPNNRYYYRVATIRNGREGEYGNYDIGMRLGPPEILYLDATYSGIIISWNTVSSSVRMYYLYRSGTVDGTYSIIDSTEIAEYFDTTDLAGPNYYKVAARIDELTELSEAAGPAQRPFPSVPYGVKASEGEDASNVTVSWNASNGAEKYLIYRAPSDSFIDMTMIGESDTVVFFDSVPSDSFYYYKVKAVNQRGESSLSTNAGRGYRIPTTTPDVPSAVDTLYGGNNVIISWEMPLRTIAYEGFNIYRSGTEDGEYELIGTATSLRYSDQPPSSYPAIYWYKVSTFNQHGESQRSTAVSGSRP